MTLNFEDVPSGVGVGMGIGSDGRHTGRRSWLWILIGSLIALVGIIVIISIFVCICARKKSDKNNRTATNKVILPVVPYAKLKAASACAFYILSYCYFPLLFLFPLISTLK